MKNLRKIVIIFFIILIILGASFMAYKINKKAEIKEENERIERETIGEEVYEKEKKQKEKFMELKQKYASKGLVLSGDIHLKKDQYALALRNYIRASKNDEEDQNIKVKIADTYFLMKNWEKAYSYYTKVAYQDLLDSKKVFFSLIYSKNLEDSKTLSGAIEAIDNFTQNNEEKFYYKNSLYCLEDFHICKQKFQDFLYKEGYKPKTEELKDVKQAIENYNALQIEELYYKNSLIVGTFLKNKLYPLSIILGKQILEEKPNYKPILKIISQSYFDLGDYENAKKYLTKYYSLSTDDPGVSYMLGIIYQKTGDYLLSNIHFTKALKIGFEPKEDIYRLQIYNAYILEDEKKIVSHFNKLIESQKEPKFDDLILATYYNLINDNIAKAMSFTQIGLELYPEKEDFYGFSGWILLEKGMLDKAELALKKGFDINSKNALINLNLARVEIIKGNKTKAKIYLKRTIKLDSGGEISKIAEKQLTQLQKQETNSGSTN